MSLTHQFKRFVIRGAAAMAVSFLFIGIAAAQTNEGQLAGNVLDSTGAQIPNATITAKNEATGSTYNVQASSSGGYPAAL